MHVTYVGPGPGCRLAPVVGGVWMPAGVPVEVPDDVGRSLCEQAAFVAVTRRRCTRPVAEIPESGLSATEIPESPDPSVERR